MKNYNEIHGWFDFADLYDKLVASVPNNGIFVECGAWLGQSSSYLCDIAKNRINIYIVDHWKGSPGELDSYHKLAKEVDIYQIFLENMGSRNFTPLRMDSVSASKLFDDNSCDVVYIDMDHEYESVYNDISLWLPKVKDGGILAGHDYYNIDGVRKAVDELLPIKTLDGNSWVYQKVKL